MVSRIDSAVSTTSSNSEEDTETDTMIPLNERTPLLHSDEIVHGIAPPRSEDLVSKIDANVNIPLSQFEEMVYRADAAASSASPNSEEDTETNIETPLNERRPPARRRCEATPQPQPEHAKQDKRYLTSSSDMKRIIKVREARKKYAGMVFLLVSFDWDVLRGLQFYGLA